MVVSDLGEGDNSLSQKEGIVGVKEKKEGLKYVRN